MRSFRISPAIAFIFAVVLLDMIGFSMIMPVLPTLIRELTGQGLAEASIIGGYLALAYGALQFVSGPIMGNLSDAYGRRPILLLSVAGLVADYLLSAFAPSLAWLFIARMLTGVCGASYVPAYAYVADVTAPEERAKAFGIVTAAFGLGFIIGPAIGGLLGAYGSRIPFFAAAGLAALNLVYGYFLVPESLPPEKRRPFDLKRANPLGAFKVFRSYPGVLPGALTLSAFYLAMAVYPAIWPYWVQTHFGWNEAMVGLTLAAYGLLMVLIQFFATGPVTAWLGERRTVMLGLTCAIVGAALYGSTAGLLTLVLVLLLHSPESLVMPAMTAMLTRDVPENAQGELQGGLASMENVATLLGTLLFTQVFGATSGPNAIVAFHSAALYLSGLIALASLTGFVLRRRAS